MAKSRRSLFPILFVCVLLVIIALLAIPKYREMKVEIIRANALSNLSHLAEALSEFDSDYGGFPSLETKDLLIGEGKRIPDGDTANAYLSQLLISGVLDSEKVFYVPRLRGTKEGDDIFDSPSTALAQGENGWGYVNPFEVASLSHNFGPGSSVPILVAPLIKGGTSPVFDRELLQGIAIYLKLDSSVGTGKINENGEVFSNQSGRNIFNNGDDSLWGDDTPILRAPWYLE